MSKTALLPTVTAVRMAWAMTGKFSDDVSKTIAANVEDGLKSIEDQASIAGPDEKSYVTCAVATIKSSLRSLNIVYKGRELNFKENETLRQAYLDSVKDSLDFGNKAKDFLKSLPTMTIGAAGSVTVAKAIGASDFVLWGIGLSLAGVGYGVQRWFVQRGRMQTQTLYVSQDYERDLYYAQYVDRVIDILTGLFLDLERIHKRVYNENYEVDIATSTLRDFIRKDILAGVQENLCPYVHKHMIAKMVTPELWPRCESGNSEAEQVCPLWEGEGKSTTAVR